MTKESEMQETIFIFSEVFDSFNATITGLDSLQKNVK